MHQIGAAGLYMEYIQHLDDRLEAVEKTQKNQPPEEDGSSAKDDSSAEANAATNDGPSKKPIVSDIQYHVDYLDHDDSIRYTTPGEQASFEPKGGETVKEIPHAIEVRKKILVRDTKRY